MCLSISNGALRCSSAFPTATAKPTRRMTGRSGRSFPTHATEESVTPALAEFLIWRSKESRALPSSDATRAKPSGVAKVRPLAIVRIEGFDLERNIFCL
jgi:hypothetical protein